LGVAEISLKKLVGAYLVLAGVIGLLSVGLNSPVLAVVFFPVTLFNMFIGGLELGGLPLVGSILTIYAGSLLAILMGIILI
jgi:hypothetical protein